MKNLLISLLFGIAVAAQAQTPTPTATPTPTPTPLIFGKIPVSTKMPDSARISSGQLYGLGPYISTNVARVDPAGNDSTGTIGDLTKPFKTVQAAINAFQVSPPLSPPWPLIKLGNNSFGEDLTCSITEIWFQGPSGGEFAAQAFASLTMSGDSPNVGLIGCTSGDISANGSSLFVFPQGGATISGNITNSGGTVILRTRPGDGTFEGTISAPGNNITIENFNNDSGNHIVIDSAGSNISATRTRIKNILSSDNTVTLIDSRVTGTNNSLAGTSQADIMLNPATMDFSGLPSSEPGDGIHAWINGAFINAPGYTFPTSDQFDGKSVWVDQGSVLVLKLSSTPTPTPTPTPP